MKPSVLKAHRVNLEEGLEQEEQVLAFSRTQVKAVAVVEEICELLWPRGDGEHAWEAEDLETIADILTKAGFHPGDP